MKLLSQEVIVTHQVVKAQFTPPEPLQKIKIIVELLVTSVLEGLEIVREVDLVLIIQTEVELEPDHDESQDSLEDAGKPFFSPSAHLWGIRGNVTADGEQLERGEGGQDVHLQHVRKTQV